MARLWKDNAFSTLAASIDNVDTALIVATGQGDRFPVVTAPDHCLITLADAGGNIEIVRVTARALGSDTLTVVRAQDSTTARAWAPGDIVSLRATASGFTSYEGHINAQTAAHAATAISNTPAGNIAATTVQAAINELDTEKTTPAYASSVATAMAIALG